MFLYCFRLPSPSIAFWYAKKYKYKDLRNVQAKRESDHTVINCERKSKLSQASSRLRNVEVNEKYWKQVF